MAKKDLDSILNSYKEKYGKQKEVFVPSGSVILDMVVSNGKGLPLGKFIEIASDSGLGKSTICLHACKSACSQGHKVVYLDVEGGTNDSQFEGIGLEPYIENGLFTVLEIQTYEEAEDIFNQLIGEVSFIVIDSLTNLIPSELLEKSIADVLPGFKSRYMTNFLEKFRGQINHSTTSVIFVNQIRNKFNFRGQTTQDSTGGYAMKFNMDVRLFMKKAQKMEKQMETANGKKSVEYGAINTIWSKKNRFNKPFIEASIAVVYGKGISNLASYQTWLDTNGCLKRSGSWYTVLFDGEEVGKACGASGVMQWMRENFEALQAYVETHGGFELTPRERTEGDED